MKKFPPFWLDTVNEMSLAAMGTMKTTSGFT